jgi:hypothetical protein
LEGAAAPIIAISLRSVSDALAKPAQQSIQTVTLNVCNGSLEDTETLIYDVCFTCESGWPSMSALCQKRTRALLGSSLAGAMLCCGLVSGRKYIPGGDKHGGDHWADHTHV